MHSTQFPWLTSKHIKHGLSNGCFLVLWKLLLVSYCAVVWALFNVFFFNLLYYFICWLRHPQYRETTLIVSVFLFPSRGIERSRVNVTLEMKFCQPYPTIVQVTEPDEWANFYLPSFVELHRCLGGCMLHPSKLMITTTLCFQLSVEK